MTAVGQIIEEILANGINDSDENITFCLCDYNDSQAIDYIPKRTVLAGHNRDDGNDYKVKVGSNGELIH